MNHALSRPALRKRRPLAPLLAGSLIALGAALPAAAQSTAGTASTGSERYSILPYTSNGYVGINLGKPDFKTSCGSTTAFACDDPSTGLRVYAGGMFNPWLGLEVGYLDLGKAERLGGDTRARGLNFSLVGRVPVGERLGVFAKLGTTYGRTSVSADPLSGVATGKESDWGASYAVGASYDVARNWTAVLEHERHNFRFAGGEREPVNMTSVGLRYRF